MPQVHNKKLSMEVDTSAFGKNSRYMSSLKYSEGTKRRIKAFNKVEHRLNRYKVRYYNRHAEIYRNRHKREQLELVNNLKRTIAYKLVCRKNSITNTTDYYKALNKNYSQFALRHEIDHMMTYMEPEKVRERKADALIDENRKLYQSLLQRNRKSIDLICPPKQKWRGYLLNDDSDDEYEDLDDYSDTSSVKSAVVKKEHKDKFLPNGKEKLPPLSRSPTKGLLPIRKQGITKAFMMQREASSSIQTPGNKPLPSLPADDKPQYELPPLQIRKKMDQRLQIPVH